jgi:hypothetical protein
MEAQQRQQALPVNRCFGGNCPQDPDEAVKAALQRAADKKTRKRAEAELKDLLKTSKGSLFRLIPVVLSRAITSAIYREVAKVLLERIRRNQWEGLDQDHRNVVDQAEASLKRLTN